tara:strand:+ start:7450 stop:7875 length:426 start_codon:yes stop_codon:yes gene_type:complete
MDNMNRVPKGIPSSGQFAAHRPLDADIKLTETQEAAAPLQPSGRSKALRVFEIRSRRYGKRQEMAAGYTLAQIAGLLGVSTSTLSKDAYEVSEGEGFDAAIARPGITFYANQGGTPAEQRFVPANEFVQRRPVDKWATPER